MLDDFIRLYSPAFRLGTAVGDNHGNNGAGWPELCGDIPGKNDIGDMVADLDNGLATCILQDFAQTLHARFSRWLLSFR